MSKKSKIRWGQNDKDNLQRLINNYNAKLYRLEKNHPEMKNYLPERMSKKQAIESIETRADFNRLTKSLQRFTKRGSEKLVESRYRGKTTKWQRAEDNYQLNRVVNAFNRKLDKVATSDNIEYLPYKLNRKEVKEDIKNLQDYEHFIDRHKSFLKEGAENIVSSKRGAKNTQWAIDEMYKNEAKDNERKAKRLEELNSKEVTIANKDTGVTRAEMGRIKENEVKPSHKNYDNMSQEEFLRASRLLEKKMHSSYSDKQKLNKLIHYCVGLEAQGLGDIVEIMKHVDLDKFIDLLDTDEVADFDFIYDPVDLQVRREKLTELWKEYATNEDEHLIEYNGVDENGKQILIRL